MPDDTAPLPPLPWRDHLTPEEALLLSVAEAARDEWHRLAPVKANIQRRAADRAARAIRRK